MAIINERNFLRWDTNPAISSDSDLPYPYVRERKNCLYKPLFIPGEEYAFYVNAAAGVTSVGICKLFLYNNGARVGDEIATINNIILPSGIKQLKCVFIMPAASKGDYQLEIHSLHLNLLF